MTQRFIKKILSCMSPYAPPSNLARNRPAHTKKTRPIRSLVIQCNTPKRTKNGLSLPHEGNRFKLSLISIIVE